MKVLSLLTFTFLLKQSISFKFSFVPRFRCVMRRFIVTPDVVCIGDVLFDCIAEVSKEASQNKCMPKHLSLD